jgi:hypothetical protein
MNLVQARCPDTDEKAFGLERTVSMVSLGPRNASLGEEIYLANCGFSNLPRNFVPDFLQ